MCVIIYEEIMLTIPSIAVASRCCFSSGLAHSIIRCKSTSTCFLSSQRITPVCADMPTFIQSSTTTMRSKCFTIGSPNSNTANGWTKPVVATLVRLFDVPNFSWKMTQSDVEKHFFLLPPFTDEPWK